MSLPAALAPRRTRVRMGVGAAIVLFLVGVAAAVLFSAVAQTGQSVDLGGTVGGAVSGTVGGPTGPEAGSEGGAGDASSSTSAPQLSATIFVHILGAVKNAGLYELRDGARAVDAVAAAGGFANDADQAQINLARFVVDGEQIIVPVVGQGGLSGVGANGSVGGGSAGGAVVPGKVNINTADAATLETLPRIGPAMSARIIAWRDANGRFSTVEDLMSVTGVGDKTFDGLKDLVTV